MNRSKPVYELIDTHKRYRNLAALYDINLNINYGERVALVGSSGAGKSTMLGLLNGTIVPTNGQVLIFGEDSSHLDSRQLRLLQARIGTIYQQFHLVNNLQVIHNVNAGSLSRWSFLKSVFSLVRPLEVDRAHRALDRVGIPEKLYNRTDQLSGGQQQRVAIARVMVQNPEVVLADEPVSSLDPQRGRDIVELLVGLSSDSGKTLVASLHVVELALKYFQRVVGLKRGRIFFDLPAEGVTPNLIGQLYDTEREAVYG